MAEQGRFFHPAKARNTPIGGANYALHVDALLVTKFLRKYAEERGLKRTEGKVVEVGQRDDGFIESVTLASGSEGRRRLLHRLHRFQEPAHRQDPGRRERRLVQLSTLRSRRGLQDREQGSAAAVHARHRAAGGLELAHSAAAARRQRLCVLEPLRERRRRESHAAAFAGRGLHRRAARHSVHHRTSPPVLEAQLPVVGPRRPDSSSRSRRRRST